MPSFIDLAQALIIISMISVHVLGYGMLLTRAANFSDQDPWILTAAICGAGATALGFEMWALGYVNGWSQLTFCISSIVALLTVIFITKRQMKAILVSLSIASIKSIFHREDNSTLVLAMKLFAITTACVAAVSCLRPAVNTDEVDYHWPAPLLWASSHHWVESPYRFCNGPSFIELLYLPSALFHNVTAGHFTHLLLWIILLISCCALGKLLQATPLPVLVSVMACPTVTTQASAMLNDLGATSFIVAALVVLFTLQNGRFVYKRIMLFAFIFCGALSSKQPFALGIMPVIVAYLFFALEATNLKERISRVLVFLVPCLLTESLWLLHTFCLSRKLIDLPVAAIWSSHNESGDTAHPFTGATGLASPPSPKKFLILLATPFITWLIGNQEPFGNRTGLVVPIFLPVFLLTIRHFNQAQKRLGLWIFATSAFYFISVGLFVVRTRYHMLVWAIWSALAGVGFVKAKERVGGTKLKLLSASFCLALLLGGVDSCRTLLQWTPHTPHYLPQLPWLLGT